MVLPSRLLSRAPRKWRAAHVCAGLAPSCCPRCHCYVINFFSFRCVSFRVVVSSCAPENRSLWQPSPYVCVCSGMNAFSRRMNPNRHVAGAFLTRFVTPSWHNTCYLQATVVASFAVPNSFTDGRGIDPPLLYSCSVSAVVGSQSFSTTCLHGKWRRKKYDILGLVFGKCNTGSCVVGGACQFVSQPEKDRMNARACSPLPVD